MENLQADCLESLSSPRPAKGAEKRNEICTESEDQVSNASSLLVTPLNMTHEYAKIMVSEYILSVIQQKTTCGHYSHIMFLILCNLHMQCKFKLIYIKVIYKS